MSNEAVLTLDWPAIAGSGFVAVVLLGALVERLRRTFATRDELNGVGDKYNALESLYLQVRGVADEARDRCSATDVRQQHHWERINAQVFQPLQRISEKLEAIGETQAVHASMLAQAGKRLDRIEEQLASGFPFPSRSTTQWREP